MLFTLEALNALHGDALLLHWGDRSNKKLCLIDSGPPSVYKASMRPRLEQLRKARAPQGSLTVDLLMVSHIDDDHVGGVENLLKELSKAEDAGETPPWNVLAVWHNSFDDILGNTATIKPAELAGLAGVSEEGGAVLASFNQGRNVRNLVKKLAITINPGFKPTGGAPAGLVGVPADGKPVNLSSPPLALPFTVISPSQSRVDNLQKDWDKNVKKKGPAEIAAYLDESVYNLSSIVVIAEWKKKTMLLTGDARGDDIITGLKAAGKITSTKKSVAFDVLKVPHHGSDRNVETEFFRVVKADHYVISADGKHDNPEKATFKMIFEARQGEKFTLHLTNELPWMKKFFADCKKKGGKFDVVIRDTAALGMSLHLGDEKP